MRLRYYLLRRLLLIIPVLIGLSIVTFAISHIVPGDPIRLAAGPQATAEQIQKLQEEFGIDKPLYAQYLNYMRGVLRGNFGTSMMNRHPVAMDLKRFFPATFELVLVSTAIAVIIGLPMAIAAAVFRDRWPDQFSRVVALSSISMPVFWLGMVLQLILGMKFHLLPISGRFDPRVPFPPNVTGMLLVDSLLAADLESFRIAVKHMALPAFCQALIGIALITRLLRADILEVMQRDFVTMARASGLPERVILAKYVLKNALIATVAMLGFLFGWQLGGSVMIETVFDWPGIGLYAVKSAMTLDFQPIMGITLFVGLLFTIVNLLVDISYGIIDPRIRYG
ncbi:MAG: ABC transporter permease subunit [Anaerolineae bacterium]|nr:ABC transporter permease subunit [Anaerolineae bacterium]NIN96741.1 ABC transporter permease subunit [Anaerolineae bacterium]NIQ79737.1 ABC transporter permease subunit [Anaerolineae bacterium]